MGQPFRQGAAKQSVRGTCAFILRLGAGFAGLRQREPVRASSARAATAAPSTAAGGAGRPARASAIWASRWYPPGLSRVVATVTGRMPARARGRMFSASAPPEKEMGSAPPNSSASLAARDRDRGYRARPDRYISPLGSSPAFTSTGKVLVSFTPKASPRFSPRASSRRSMGTASPHCKSFRKWWSSKAR